MIHFLALLLSVVPIGDVVRESVDLIELNHFYDEHGRLVFDQVIFWDERVVAWRLDKGQIEIQREWPSGYFVARFDDGGIYREVRARSLEDTWTQVGFEGDPELNDREILAKEKRRELSRPGRKIAKITGRGCVQHPVPKHEQPVKEVAMSGNESSCAAPVQKSDAIEYREIAIGGVSYRPIPGFSRYYAGEDGSVGTFMVKGNPRRIGDSFRLMKQRRDKASGYLFLSLSDDNSKIHTMSGHRCVLLAFVGPCPAGMEACHDPDPTRTNNRRSNLRWDTRKNNHADKWKHGTQQAGSQHAQAKLNEDDVLKIKHRLVRGETLKAIAADYEVDWTTISLIRTGKHWPNVAPELHALFPPSYRSRRFGVDLTKLAKDHGMSKQTLYKRLSQGESLAQALRPVDVTYLPHSDPRRLTA